MASTWARRRAGRDDQTDNNLYGRGVSSLPAFNFKAEKLPHRLAVAGGVNCHR